MTKCNMNRVHAARKIDDDVAARISVHVTAIVALLSQPVERDEDLLPLPVAARVAATSTRVVKDAIRAGEIVAFGGQRDRSVRRADLRAWIESRKVVHAAIDDADIEKRMRRIGGRK